MLQRLSFIPLRIAQAVPVVFGVTIVVFFLVRLLPGGPAVALLGEHATPEAVAAVNHQYGLDGPIWIQYADFLRHVVTGNLGISASQGTWIITSYSVAEAISVPLTGWLAGRFGAVRLMTSAMALFGIFSAMCGFSASLL